MQREGLPFCRATRGHPGYQQQEGPNRGTGEAVHQRRTVEGAPAARKGEGKQQAADHGAERVGDLEDAGAPGHGIDEVLLGNQGGHQGRGGRPGEATAQADDKQNRVHGPHLAHAMQREEQQGEGRAELQRIAPQNDGATIVAVRHVTGRQGEEEARQKERKAGVPQGQCRMGELVDLPGDAHALGLGPHDPCEPSGLVQTEIPVLPRHGRGIRARTILIRHVSMVPQQHPAAGADTLGVAVAGAKDAQFAGPYVASRGRMQTCGEVRR